MAATPLLWYRERALTSLNRAAITIADYNKDGYKDIAICGGGAVYSQCYFMGKTTATARLPTITAAPLAMGLAVIWILPILTAMAL